MENEIPAASTDDDKANPAMTRLLAAVGASSLLG
jgi:hypothetical protein